jgi:hypothetical protein
MMRYLKQISNDCQVFITTHSTNFLDMAEMSNVYLVSRTESTQVQLVDYDDAESQIPQELGMRLSSFFMFDRLVFVEGPTDEAILRELASKIGVNLAQANVGFVRMGGARNFAYYATESALSFLTKRRVKVWFLLDRDERDDKAVAGYFEKLGSHAAVRIMERREIENYLLVPRAIAQFVAVKRRLAGQADIDPPSEAEVKAALDEQADRLQSVVIGKRIAARMCSPVYPNLKRIVESLEGGEAPETIRTELDQMVGQLTGKLAQLDEVHREISEATVSSWSLERMCMVQGDLLLDRVCRDFGVRFVKEVDGSRLASLLDPSEVATEIRGLLQEIER